jgi:hypothetical protein
MKNGKTGKSVQSARRWFLPAVEIAVQSRRQARVARIAQPKNQRARSNHKKISRFLIAMRAGLGTLNNFKTNRSMKFG